MTALPHFSALMMLLAGVAPGFVDGTTAATTPTGRAISVMPSSGSSLSTPVEIAPCRSRSRPSVLRWFLLILSSTLPSPVSRTAISASRRLRDGSMIAQPAAVDEFVELSLGVSAIGGLRRACAPDEIAYDLCCSICRGPGFHHVAMR